MCCCCGCGPNGSRFSHSVLLLIIFVLCIGGACKELSADREKFFAKPELLQGVEIGALVSQILGGICVVLESLHVCKSHRLWAYLGLAGTSLTCATSLLLYLVQALTTRDHEGKVFFWSASGGVCLLWLWYLASWQYRYRLATCTINGKSTQTSPPAEPFGMDLPQLDDVSEGHATASVDDSRV